MEIKRILIIIKICYKMNNAGCYDLSSKAKYIYDSDQEQQYYMHESNIFRSTHFVKTAEKSMSTISNKQKDKLGQMKKSNSFTVNQNLSQQSIKAVPVRVKDQKGIDKNKLNDKCLKKCNNLNTNTTSNKTNSFEPNINNKWEKKKVNKTSTSIVSSDKNIKKTKEKEKDGKNKGKSRAIKDYLIINETIYQCGDWQEVAKKLICGGEEGLYNQSRFIKSTLKNQQKIERYMKSFLQSLKFEKRASQIEIEVEIERGYNDKDKDNEKDKDKEITQNRMKIGVSARNCPQSIFYSLSNKQKLYLYDLLKKQTINEMEGLKQESPNNIRIQNYLDLPNGKPLLSLNQQKSQQQQIKGYFTIQEKKNQNQPTWRNEKLSELVTNNSSYGDKIILMRKNKKYYMQATEQKSDSFDFRSSQKDIIMIDQEEQNSVSFQIVAKNDEQGFNSEDQIPTKTTLQLNSPYTNYGNEYNCTNREEQQMYKNQHDQIQLQIKIQKDRPQAATGICHQSYRLEKFSSFKVNLQQMRALPSQHILAAEGIKEFLYQFWDFLVDSEYIGTILKRLKQSYGLSIQDKLLVIGHLLFQKQEEARQRLNKKECIIDDQVFVQFCKQNKYIEEAEPEIYRKSLIVFYKLIFDNINIRLWRFQIDFPLGAFHPLENNLNPSGYLIDEESLMIAWQQCLTQILEIEEVGAGRFALQETVQNQLSYESYKKIDEIKEYKMNELLIGEVKEELLVSPLPIFRRVVQEQLISSIQNILFQEFIDQISFFL